MTQIIRSRFRLLTLKTFVFGVALSCLLPQRSPAQQTVTNTLPKSKPAAPVNQQRPQNAPPSRPVAQQPSVQRNQNNQFNPPRTAQPRQIQPAVQQHQPMPGSQQRQSQSPPAVPQRQPNRPSRTSSAPIPRAPSISPAAHKQLLPDGRSLVRDQAGHSYTLNRNGRVGEFSGNGIRARYNPAGRASVIQTSHNGASTLVIHGSNNVHIIDTKRPDGVRVVSYGPQAGFVQRPIAGRPDLVSRTIVNGRSSRVAVYRSYTYRNQVFYRFVPTRYYPPAFYAWVNQPWGPSVSFSWGAPLWASNYGAYFTPYPAYPTASLWLTDYVLHANLDAAYSERQGVAANPDYYGPDSSQDTGESLQQDPGSNPLSDNALGSTELSPDVKTLISKEVSSYVGQLQNVSQTLPAGNGAPIVPASFEDPTPDALKPGLSAFQISTDMQLDVSDTQSCALTPGDVLFRKSITPDQDGRVQVVVVGRKQGDCEMNTLASIPVATLDQINSDFDRQLQAGLAVLAAKNGKDGFPGSPDTTTTNLLLASTERDPDASSMLQQNQASGQQAELELTNATGGVH